jgi:hypothetical protein
VPRRASRALRVSAEDDLDSESSSAAEGRSLVPRGAVADRCTRTRGTLTTAPEICLRGRTSLGSLARTASAGARANETHVCITSAMFQDETGVCGHPVCVCRCVSLRPSLTRLSKNFPAPSSHF